MEVWVWVVEGWDPSCGSTSTVALGRRGERAAQLMCVWHTGCIVRGSPSNPLRS